MNRGHVRSIVAVAVTLASAAFLLPKSVEARGGWGHHRPFFRVARPYGLFGYSMFGLGPGFGPYLGPHYLRPEGGVDLNIAMMVGWGAVDLDVKPRQAEVWVDGNYVGEARDLDGRPSFLWLEAGPHRLTIYKGGHATFEENISVQRGIEKDLKVRLKEGDSEPPGRRPDEVV